MSSFSFFVKVLKFFCMNSFIVLDLHDERAKEPAATSVMFFKKFLREFVLVGFFIMVYF